MAKKRKLDGTIAKSNAGRPSKMTPDVIAKLEQAFAIDCSVEEACSYADIGRDTFYDYIKLKPQFSDRIDELRQRPVLKARQAVVKSLDNPQHAFEYLKRKRKKEFGDGLDVTTGGQKLITKITINTPNGKGA